MPLQHFFSTVPRSRDNLTRVCFNTFCGKGELALASSTCFSAQRFFDPTKQSSLAVNSRNTKHWFVSLLVRRFVGSKGTCLLFSSRMFDNPSPLLEF